MNQRTALITGAASGIGLGIARELAQKGLKVIVTDLQQAGVDQAVAQLTADGALCEGFKLDVTSDQDLQQLMSSLHNQRVDVLINNAGIQHVSRLEDFPMEKWQLIIEVLLTAPARLSKAFLPGMREQGFGRIVNIGSLHGVVASPFKSAYVAAKHGLLGFSKVLALETADTDITINTICPAYVKTPLVEKQIADQAKTHNISEDEVINRIMLEPMPKKAFIDIAEIAHIADFLIDENARNITGQALVVDGGWTIK